MDQEPEAIESQDAEAPQETAGPPPTNSPIPSFFSRAESQPVPDEPQGQVKDSMSAFISRTMAAVADSDESEGDSLLPRAPRSFQEIGLSKAFLTDLALKIVHYSGTPSMSQLVRRLGLNNDIVSQIISALNEERLIEVLSQSDLYTGNYRYRLSDRGQVRVAEALERSRYAGPVPVTADQYSAVMKRMLEFRQESSSRARIKALLHELVLSGEVSDALARAMFSGKSAIIYGPSGNGKTVLLERYAQDMGGFTLMPYAIYAYGQVIRVFDQSIHQPTDASGDPEAKEDGRRDRRWVTVKRPAIILGAEMDRDALELAYDPAARFYQAPPHVKAQNGALIIDDFGRQRMETRDLLTRWLIPLERGWDTLTLVTGEKLVIPFKTQLLFATNQRIKDLADDALLRRILYKVHIPNPDRANFGEILRQTCRQKKVRVEDGALEYAIDRLFADERIPVRSSYARDILDILIESASYDGNEAVLNKESFDRVYRLFLAQDAEEDEYELPSA
jgi:MoxR-like ATPase